MKYQFPENFWWGSAASGPQTEGVFEGDGAGEGQVPAQLDEGLGVLHAAGVAVEHAAHTGELLHDGQAVPVGLPVVDDDGHI